MLLFKAARKDPTLSPVLTASQKRIMRILGDAMRQVRATTEREEGKILDAILHGPTTRVTALIPTEPWLEAQALIEEELAAELVAAGHRYGRQVPALRKAVVDFRFDASRPEAASWAAKHAGQLIVQIMQHQQTIVQDYVSRASMGEMAPREVAAGLRNVIGLTNEQAGWVQNFEARQLAAIDGVPTKRDLDRVAAATSRYHDRVHRYRTENIARTEILSASHEGRRQAWAQGLQEGYISPTAMQEWSAEMDGRVCPICSAMDGQKVPVGEQFPHGEPPIHPSCRCDVLLLDAAPAGPWDEMSDEELDAQLESLLSGETLPSTPSGSISDRLAQAQTDGRPIGASDVLRTDIQALAREYSPSMTQSGPDYSSALKAYRERATELVEKHLQEVKATMGPDEFRTYSDALRKRIDGDLISNIEYARATPQERTAIADYVRTAQREGDAMVAVPSDTIDAILADGRIKTQFETGRSGGTVSVEARASTETAMFDIHPTVVAEQRPVYGYVSTSTKTPDGVSVYGDIRLEIADSVKERATMTLGDSLGTAPRPISLRPGTSVTDQDAWDSLGVTNTYRVRNADLPLAERAQLFEQGDGYIEMQIQGGLRLHEIKAAHVPEGLAHDSVAAKLLEAGIQVVRYSR